MIDISPTGAQPMSDATGRWTVTFNGEIYNYRSVRTELEGLGRKFLTNSDTEVLINAIAQWGTAGLSKLMGMYAFALWDSSEQELWLARDPYGIKPLYYAVDGETIWFASQARALAHGAPIDCRRDQAGLTGFFLWGHVPEPFTWWAGIVALPAGQFLRVRSGSTQLKPDAHCLIENSYLSQEPAALHQGELRELLIDTVRLHLVSDVPVGVFLSAGIDSAVITALATELGAKLQTLTLSFEEFAGTRQDEGPLAEELARALGTNHRTIRVGRDEFNAMLDDFFAAMDQPTIDGLNVFMVSRVAAAEGMKVALSGLGGDELFGGYPSFRRIPKLVRWSRVAHSVPFLARAAEALARLTPKFPSKAADIFDRPVDTITAYFLLRALHLESELEELLDASRARAGLRKLETSKALTRTISDLKSVGTSLHAQISALEACWYMRNQLLRDADWASMAHGVEVRVPFVDAALLTKIGPAIASQRPPTKRDLAACSSLVPSTITERRKTGFTTPVREWITARTGLGGRGLQNWANYVDRRFRDVPDPDSPRSRNAAIA